MVAHWIGDALMRCILQGSISGPLLFLIYGNDLVDNIKSVPSAFANDTALMKVLNNESDVLAMIYLLLVIGLTSGDLHLMLRKHPT